MTRLLLILNLFFLSCHSLSTSDNSKKASLETIPSLPADAQIDSYGDTSYFFLQHKQISRELGLPEISENREDIEVRIWTSSQLTVEGDHYFALRRLNGKWKGELWNLQLEGAMKTNGAELIAKKERVELSLQPKWGGLYDSLIKLNLLTLPDCSHIEGYGYGLDGSNYVVEVSTPAIHRFYIYWTPQNYRKRYMHADNMMKMLEMLERELNVDL